MTELEELVLEHALKFNIRNVVNYIMSLKKGKKAHPEYSSVVMSMLMLYTLEETLQKHSTDPEKIDPGVIEVFVAMVRDMYTRAKFSRSKVVVSFILKLRLLELITLVADKKQTFASVVSRLDEYFPKPPCDFWVDFAVHYGLEPGSVEYLGKQAKTSRLYIMNFLIQSRKSSREDSNNNNNNNSNTFLKNKDMSTTDIVTGVSVSSENSQQPESTDLDSATTTPIQNYVEMNKLCQALSQLAGQFRHDLTQELPLTRLELLQRDNDAVKRNMAGSRSLSIIKTVLCNDFTAPITELELMAMLEAHEAILRPVVLSELLDDSGLV